MIGASTNPARFSNTAVKELQNNGIPVEAIGLRNEHIGNVEIKTGFPVIEGVHTVTMYVSAQNQPHYIDYILNRLNPTRIIFNPGTENDDFEQIATEKGIEVVRNCTLVMLEYGIF